MWELQFHRSKYEKENIIIKSNVKNNSICKIYNLASFTIYLMGQLIPPRPTLGIVHYKYIVVSRRSTPLLPVHPIHPPFCHCWTHNALSQGHCLYNWKLSSEKGAVGSSGTAATVGGNTGHLLPLWGQFSCQLMVQPGCATLSITCTLYGKPPSCK